MDKSIRASSVGTFNTCAYKYKNDVFDLAIKDSYLGNLVHTYARHPELGETMLDYYIQQVYTDMKLMVTTRKMFKNIDKFLAGIEAKLRSLDENGIRKKTGSISYEIPFATRILEKDGDKMWMTGTADMIVIWPDQSMTVYDRKTTNNVDFFENKYREDKDAESDIWETNKQRVCYPFGAMQMFQKSKCSFSFITLSKKNGKLKEFSKDVEREPALKELQVIYGKYTTCEKFDMRPAKKSRICHFCKLKPDCPLYNIKL